MKPDFPRASDEPALRALWRAAFGDTDAFLDGFFKTGFHPDRCRCMVEDGEAKSALYWFDCALGGRKYAYLYAVATAENARSRGLCTALMANTHAHLRQLGYAGAILVPGEASLFSFYEKQGYRTAACVDEFTCEASDAPPLPLRALTAGEYDRLRKVFLPHGGMEQAGQTTRFLGSYARFACGEGFLIAYSADGDRLICHELLGRGDFGGILRTLGCKSGSFRTPGRGKPFAMFLPLCDDAPVPEYFGLALD